MKFPRNAKIFSGRLDIAPVAGVFFLLGLFVLLGVLVYTPGAQIRLPVAADLPGTDQATIAVAVDAGGRFYFENQIVPETLLGPRLASAVKQSSSPLTLLVQADRAVSYDIIIRLTLLARAAGVKNALLATAPPPAAAHP